MVQKIEREEHQDCKTESIQLCPHQGGMGALHESAVENDGGG